MPTALAVLPFALLVLALALGQAVAAGAWSKRRNQALVVAALSLPVLLWLGIARGAEGREALLGAARDYAGFLAYMGSLYAVTSTVSVTGSFRGGPVVNSMFLVLGAALASVVGTTGASLILLRPLLRANKGRPGATLAVIFFIFIVANGGGLLSPLGDPPLLLGFLRGAPFSWPFRALLPVWGTFVALAVLAYLGLATWKERKEIAREPEGEVVREIESLERLGIVGWPSLLVLGAIAASTVGLARAGTPVLLNAAVLAALAVTSLALAPRERRREIHWEPLSEVAIVFAGVFATVTPVLELVRAHGPDLPLGTPARDFLIAGALSSVLDNAPTYLVLVEGAASANRSLAQPLAGVGTTGVPESVLAAISCGCVLMGANTYIGNGPNLLVRAMAEKDGVAMPGFFRFLGWSVLVLGPIYAAIVVVFFR